MGGAIEEKDKDMRERRERTARGNELGGLMKGEIILRRGEEKHT